MALHPYSSFLHPLFADIAPFFEGTACSRPSRSSHAQRGIAMDVVETQHGFHIKADLPGVAKGDVRISQDGDVLSLEVQQQQEDRRDEERDGAVYHRSERSSSFARRSIRLPDSADFARVKAKLDNGVLTLDVPKKPEEEKRAKQITVE